MKTRAFTILFVRQFAKGTSRLDKAYCRTYRTDAKFSSARFLINHIDDRFDV